MSGTCGRTIYSHNCLAPPPHAAHQLGLTLLWDGVPLLNQHLSQFSLCDFVGHSGANSKPKLIPQVFNVIKVLTRLRHYLCDKIRADRHLDYLRSRRILTRDDAEEISCRSTQSKRTATLLDILAENPRGLDALIDSIREMRSQNFIIAKITDEVQKAKNEKIESLRASGVSCSSSDSPFSSPSTTSDLPNTFSNNSTLLFHPDGEQSPSTSDVAGSLNMPSLQKCNNLPSDVCASVGVASSSLPKPGDPGAPPLPDEILLESPSNMDATTPGCTSSGGDSNFHPLRSRSLTPTSHRSVF